MMHSQSLVVLNTLNILAQLEITPSLMLSLLTLEDSSQLRCLLWTQEKPDTSIQF